MAASRLLAMEGSGNDFLVGVGDWSRRLQTEPDLRVRLCRRRRGIGADGVLALDIDGRDSVRLHYFNADGSRAAFCANGTRCAAAAAVHLLGLSSPVTVNTDWVAVPAEVGNGEVTLSLPLPDPGTPKTLEAGGRTWPGRVVTVGVPHLLIHVDRSALDAFLEWAPILRRHPDLGPEGANITFTHRDDDGCLVLRTFERGVEGETLSCGSAMVAAGWVEMTERGLDHVTLRPASGDRVTVSTTASGLSLTGPVRRIAEVVPLEEG